MNFLRKMERKFGRYAIHNLMYYIIILYGMGIIISMFESSSGISIYSRYLSLNASAILQGQVWRIVTFLICPPSRGIFFNLIAMYLYYSLGTNLEQVWGTFRFNVYFFMGMLGHVLGALLIYMFTGYSLEFTTYYLNFSLFFAFAATFPDMQFLLIILPIKAKWLALFFGFDFLYSFVMGGAVTRWEIILSLLNFIIFFLMTRNYNRVNPKEIKRKKEFKQQVNNVTKITHHKCAVCGRTEKDDPNLEFRYCSKCEGDFEYCMDHLYTHKHVIKGEQG